jgi:hypothetical protein
VIGAQPASQWLAALTGFLVFLGLNRYRILVVTPARILVLDAGSVNSALTCGYYRTASPVTARPTIIRWISEVPSKIVKIFASRCHRSTG